ncbi:uncharacterized protein LTR77_003226 [Saxophila tyrrhenica]|uniref:Uncharacterized protein n=1 Tax=Saxophila tyrrhenica TaxID=1690608 RepID=A0AAV9PJL0_9PEZI|nr:hypothetical protein LTR77_003226 [Saxophila tyrrhenica]
MEISRRALGLDARRADKQRNDSGGQDDGSVQDGPQQTHAPAKYKSAHAVALDATLKSWPKLRDVQICISVDEAPRTIRIGAVSDGLAGTASAFHARKKRQVGETARSEMIEVPLLHVHIEREHMQGTADYAKRMLERLPVPVDELSTQHLQTLFHSAAVAGSGKNGLTTRPTTGRHDLEGLPRTNGSTRAPVSKKTSPANATTTTDSTLRNKDSPAQIKDNICKVRGKENEEIGSIRAGVKKEFHLSRKIEGLWQRVKATRTAQTYEQPNAEAAHQHAKREADSAERLLERAGRRRRRDKERWFCKFELVAVERSVIRFDEELDRLDEHVLRLRNTQKVQRKERRKEKGRRRVLEHRRRRLEQEALEDVSDSEEGVERKQDGAGSRIGSCRRLILKLTTMRVSMRHERHLGS